MTFRKLPRHAPKQKNQNAVIAVMVAMFVRSIVVRSGISRDMEGSQTF